jgi:hypothetical protein
LIGFTAIDEQVGISQEQRIVFEEFFIGSLFGVVAAAIQGNVDCVDYISNLIVPLLCTSAMRLSYPRQKRTHLDRRR